MLSKLHFKSSDDLRCYTCDKNTKARHEMKAEMYGSYMQRACGFLTDKRRIQMGLYRITD